MPKDFKLYMEILTFSYFAIIHLDLPDDFFRTYTLPYQKTIESIEKGQKGSELVENRDFSIPRKIMPRMMVEFTIFTKFENSLP